MKRLLTHLGLRFFLLFSCIFLSSFFISLSAQEFVKGGAVSYTHLTLPTLPPV